MSRPIRYVELFIVTFIAAMVFSQLPVLGQEGRSDVDKGP